MTLSMEKQVALGALAGAAAAVNVALKSASAANACDNEIWDSEMYMSSDDEDDSEEEDGMFLPVVASALVDDEIVGSWEFCSGSSRNPSTDWFSNLRSVYSLDGEGFKPDGSLDDSALWRSLFRVSKPTFDYICSLVKADLGPKFSTTPGMSPIEGRFLTVEKQVAIALRRLASGDAFLPVGELFGVGTATACEVTWKFVKSLERRAQHHLKWPEAQELEDIKAAFERQEGMPNCCGAVDSTHILMELPVGESSSDWYDRDHNYSMVIQAVVDADMRFRDVLTGYPGSVSDSRLLRSSGFYKLSESGQRLSGPSICVRGVEVREYIVGDWGYPLLPWLITPFPRTGLSPCRDSFNHKHANTRIVVEKAFARLKGAWRILHRTMCRPNKKKLPHVILACCLLHNIIIDRGEVLEDGVALIGHHDETYSQQSSQFVDSCGDRVRETLAEYLFAKVTGWPQA